MGLGVDYELQPSPKPLPEPPLLPSTLPQSFFCRPAEQVAPETTPPHAATAAAVSANTPPNTKMCRLPAAALAALLLPATTTMKIGATLSTGALLVSATPSQAQTTE